MASNPGAGQGLLPPLSCRMCLGMAQLAPRGVFGHPTRSWHSLKHPYLCGDDLRPTAGAADIPAWGCTGTANTAVARHDSPDPHS
jgi:hypothetical protein